MEDYNPFAGTSAVDFNEVEKKAREAAAQDKSQPDAPQKTSAPSADADYSPFASSSGLSALSSAPAAPSEPAPPSRASSGAAPSSAGTLPRLAAPPPGVRFGSASPPGSAPAPPSYGAPSAPPMAPMGGGPVGLDGQPLPGVSAPSFGAPPASPYGAPPQYGGAPQYGAPPQGTWPPPTSAPGAYMPAQNDSGMKADVPPEIAAFKWNWGAFFLDFWWAFANKVQPYGAILLAIVCISWIPIVGAIAGLGALVIRIYLAIEGHKLAWKNRRFEGGVGEFIQVQRAWMKWGIGLSVIPFFIGIFAAILFPVFAKARQNALQGGAYSSSQPMPGYGGGSSGGDSPAAAPARGSGADSGSAGAYGLGGDGGSGDGGPSVGFHPKD